jgi:hypothetical protein
MFYLEPSPTGAKCPQGIINEMPPEAGKNNKREEERRKREGKEKGREERKGGDRCLFLFLSYRLVMSTVLVRLPFKAIFALLSAAQRRF